MCQYSKIQTYQLIIKNPEFSRIQVGALGFYDFPKGFYIYTGSAKRNMSARIRRHLRQEKKRRWHIDYFLIQPGVEIVNVLYFEESECLIQQQTPGKIIIPRFGATDCNKKCGSHLKYFGKENPEVLIAGSVRE